jgi:hypothetical protein
MALAAAPIHRLTVEQVDGLVEAGLLEDRRMELVDGILLDAVPPNPPHSQTVALLTRHLIRALPDDLQLLIQDALFIHDGFRGRAASLRHPRQPVSAPGAPPADRLATNDAPSRSLRPASSSCSRPAVARSGAGSAPASKTARGSAAPRRIGPYAAERTYRPSAPYATGVTGVALRHSQAEEYWDPTSCTPDRRYESTGHGGSRTGPRSR